jgi:hypothetical protein
MTCRTHRRLLEFCLRLVKATRPTPPRVQTQRFFEALGPEGWSALKQVVDAVQTGSNRQVAHLVIWTPGGDIARPRRMRIRLVNPGRTASA